MDQTDIDFEEWWQADGKADVKQILRAAHIAGVQSGLDQCKKIIAGDENERLLKAAHEPTPLA